MQSHVIEVMGREFKIRSNDAPEHVQEVAQYVSATFDNVKGDSLRVPLQNLLLLTSLTIADELLKERARVDKIKSKIRAQSRELLSRLGS